MIDGHDLVAQALQKEGEFPVLGAHIQDPAAPIEHAAIRAREQLLQVSQRGKRVVGIPFEADVSEALFHAASALLKMRRLLD